MSSVTELSTIEPHTEFSNQSVFSNFNPIRVDRAVTTAQLTFAQLDASWKRVGDYTWSKSAAAGSEVFSLKVPFDLVIGANVGSQMYALWQRFVFHNYDSCEVALVVTGAPTQVGMSLLYFLPGRTTETKPSNPFYLENSQRVVPHASLTYSMKTPFFYDRTYISSTDGGRCGKLIFEVIEPLYTTGLDVSISLYVRFHNHDYRIPRPTIKSVYPALQGPLVDFASTVGAALTEVSESTFAKVADTVIGTVLTMDRPSIGGNTQPVSLGVPSMSNVVGPRTTVSFQADPVGVRYNTMRSDVSVDSISALCARRHFLTSMDWKFDTAAGTRLTQIPICLMPSAYLLSAGAPSTTMSLTPIELVADAFNLWWGDITYEVVIVCNNFHSGVLRAGYYYNVGESVEYDDLETTYNTIMDISGGNHSFVITVPAAAAQQMLRNPVCGNTVSNKDFPYSGSNAITDYIYGYLSIFVVNPLRALSDDMSTVKVHVYMSAVPHFVEPRSILIHGGGTIDIAPVLTLSSITLPVGPAGLDSDDDDIVVLQGPTNSSVGMAAVASDSSTQHAQGEVGMDDSANPLSKPIASVSDPVPSVAVVEPKKYSFEIDKFSQLWTRYRPTFPQSAAFSWNSQSGVAASNLTARHYVMSSDLSKELPLFKMFYGGKGGVHYRLNFATTNNVAGGLVVLSYLPSLSSSYGSLPFTYTDANSSATKAQIDLSILVHTPLFFAANSTLAATEAWVSPTIKTYGSPAKPLDRLYVSSNKHIFPSHAYEVVPVVGGAASIDVYLPQIHFFHFTDDSYTSVGKLVVSTTPNIQMLSSFVAVSDDFEPVGLIGTTLVPSAIKLGDILPAEPTLNRCVDLGSVRIYESATGKARRKRI